MTFIFAVYAGPSSQRVGYQPTQPIPYSHDIHVNQLGLDCRYCHSFVEHGAQANVPSANVCWNCHGPNKVKSDSPMLDPLYAAMGVDRSGQETGAPKQPLEWVRVHKAPDYVFFNHSAHVNRGVSCQSCHGDVDEMKVVHHDQSLTMGWCLDCHRAPEEHLRPIEEVTNLDYDVEKYLKANPIKDAEGNAIETQTEFGKFLAAHWNVKPKESCATCHR
ncbi:cytochrome c3 family protein [Roseibacillus ishigakijimensis]|uniref:cytochrome c3 family protein n=1 Tax=Roseibacillus ishigakijimensis TaxID=454146 RepID=UPI003640BBF6